MSSPAILVIGASGAQGGAVARALLRNNWTVHALVRDTTSPASQALSSQGAQLFQGDWDNIPALQKAATNCTGLFLNSYPSFEDANAETRQAHNILAAAKDSGVKHVVYSSAIGVDRHKTLVNPEPNTFLAQYFNSKLAIETEVQNGDWESWTILRGAIFMSNFLLPGASFMYPELATEGEFVTAYEPESKLLLLDPEDIGSFAFEAFSDPGRFSGKGITLAVEGFSVQEMAILMGKVSGKKVEVRFRSDEEVEALKGVNPIVASQVALRKVHTWLDLEEVRAWGVPMGTFEQFLEKEKTRLLSSIGPQA